MDHNNNMDQIVQKVDELMAKVQTQSQQIATQSQHIANLQVSDEVTKALADDTIRIRMRFFETYRRSKRLGGDKTSSWNQSTIKAGDAAAHDGKIPVDAALYNMGRRSDKINFSEIYSVSLEEFNNLYKPYKELHAVFNHMGTIVVEAAITDNEPSDAMRKAFAAIILEVRQLKQRGLGRRIDEFIWDPSTKLGRLWDVYEAAFVEEKERLFVHR